MSSDEQEKLRDKAQLLLKEGKYLHALQIYKQLVEDKSDITSRVQLGIVLSKHGFIRESFDLFSEVLDDYGQYDNWRLFAAEIFSDAGAWNEYLKIIAELDPIKFPEVNYMLGYGYFKLKDLEKAKYYLDLFLSSDGPNEKKILSKYLYGKIAIMEEDYNKAISHFKDCEFYYTTDAEYFLYLAHSYYMLGMDTHASLYILKALRFNKTDKNILIEAAKIYNSLKEYAKAEKYLKKYAELYSTTDVIYNLVIAETFIGLGKREEAAACISIVENENNNSEEIKKLKQKIIRINKSNEN